MAGQLKVGILGGGFAGLYTVFQIKKDLGPQAEITLFDKNNYLLYTPMLHEMATGTVNPRHVVVPIRKVVSPLQVHIRCEEVTLVDLEEKAFETISGRFTFDYLVLATGSESNFYDLPGVEEHSLTFKVIMDATRIRNQMISILERGALEKNPDNQCSGWKMYRG